MTLIVAAANNRQIIVGCDRRLTTPKGELYSEQQCKLTAMICADAKSLIAFTGTAIVPNTSGDYSTEEWLLSILGKANTASSNLHQITSFICTSANELNSSFSSKYGRPLQLEILIASYWFEGDASNPSISRISNMQVEGDDGFQIYTSAPISSKSDYYFELAGTTSGVPAQSSKDIQRLMARNNQDRALEAVMFRLFQTASDSKRSSGRVGKASQVAILKPEHSGEITAIYHPEGLSREVRGINAVILGMINSQAVLKFGDAFVPIVPNIGQNKKCLCGSGLPFKKCHMGIKQSTYPLASEVEINGDKYAVRTYGYGSI